MFETPAHVSMHNDPDNTLRRSDSLSSRHLSARTNDATRYLDNHRPDCNLGGSVDNQKFSSDENQQAKVLASLERVSDSRYQIFEEVGRGGMGIVLRARDKRLQRDVAMKVIAPNRLYDSSFIDRFIEEAQISGQLQHPSIVPIYDIGKLESGHMFFTMKLVKGATLSSLLLKRSSPADNLDHWLGIFGQICQAVAFAHSKQVIHRDLKPSNVMVGRFGEVHVMDWGLAKLQIPNSNKSLREEISTDLTAISNLKTDKVHPNDKSSVMPLTDDMVSADGTQSKNTAPDLRSVIQTIRHGIDAGTESGSAMSSECDLVTAKGSVLGTVAYMPPEQASGQNEKIDFRSDVFSLGAILCEIVTGLPPYLANDKDELLQMAVSGSIDSALARINASQVESDIQKIASDCLAPTPDIRPSNAGLLASRLDDIIANGKERVRTAERENAAATARLEEATRTYAAERQNHLMILLASILSLGLLVVLIGGSILFRDREALRVSQNTLALERFRVPAASLAEIIWESRVMPVSTEFTRLMTMKADLELANSQMEIDPNLMDSVDKTLGRISLLEKARSFVLDLDHLYWDYNTFAGVYDPEKLLNGLVSHHDRTISIEQQLEAYQLMFQEMFWNGSEDNYLQSLAVPSLPRWALDEIEVALMRLHHLCSNYLSRSGDSSEIQRMLNRIDSDLKTIRIDYSYEKQMFTNDLWQAIFEHDVPLMMKLAEDPNVVEVSVPTLQALAKALLEYGPEHNSTTLQSQIDWQLIESREAYDKIRARRTKDGSVIAFEVIADLKNEDVLAVRLDTFHDFETGIGPGEEQPQLPNDANRCLVDELSLARQSADGSESTELEIMHAVSGHHLVPGREIANAVDHTSGTFWALAHAREQSVASSYFFVRPIRTARYPILRIRVDNGHPEYRQLTSLGKYSFYYARSIPEIKDAIVVAEQLMQRLPSKSLLAPRVQMTMAEIAAMASHSDLDTAVATASMAYRQSPGDTWMSELFLRLVTRLPLDSQNSWLTKVHSNLNALEHHSDSDLTRRKLGAHYSRYGDEFFEIWHQASLVMYQQALSVDPRGFKRYGRLGERLIKIGKKDEAQAVMEQGIEQAPEVAENWYYLGNLVYGLGNFNRSVSLLEQSLRHEPNDLQTRRMLCRALFKATRMNEGLEQLELLKSHDQVDHYTLSLAVSACIKMKDIDRALQLIEWWGKQEGKIVSDKKDSMLSPYYDSHSSAWYHICLAAIDEAFSESNELAIKDDKEQLDVVDPRILSIFDQMSSDPRLDWETIFAMIDRTLYGRELVEPVETLENLQRFLTVVEKKVANKNRIWIRSAAIHLKSGQEERAIGTLKNFPLNDTDPYSAFSDIIKRVLIENSRSANHTEEFVFPSDRTRLLPERDRDLAEWLWWDRPKP
jgi:serine/threonine protein kinase/tetratricopeptide (TPR) repeat protein